MTGAEGFAAVPNWMIRDETVSGPAIAVYGALASHSGKGGIHPNQGTLAREARLGERRTRDALVELELLGVVERVRRSSRGGRSSDAYLLHPNGPDQQPALDAGSGQQPAPAEGATGTTRHDVPITEEEPVKKKPARATRLSAGWMPSTDLVDQVRASVPSVDLESETASFVDYWIAVPGARGVKLDWDATWRNWMRSSHKRAVERGWKPSGSGPDYGVEEWMNR